MERLGLRYKDALRASHTLGEISKQSISFIVRDAPYNVSNIRLKPYGNFFINQSIQTKVKEIYGDAILGRNKTTTTNNCFYAGSLH